MTNAELRAIDRRCAEAIEPMPKRLPFPSIACIPSPLLAWLSQSDYDGGIRFIFWAAKPVTTDANAAMRLLDLMPLPALVKRSELWECTPAWSRWLGTDPLLRRHEKKLVAIALTFLAWAETPEGREKLGGQR